MDSNNAAASSAAADPRRNSNRPKYSKFTQQELPACKPILTPGWVISSFLIVSIVFITIGFFALSASNQVVEIVERYDDKCVSEDLKSDKVKYIKSSKNKTCITNLTVPKDMKNPIYVYYQLDNFYQNHRRYVKSRSDQQLRDLKYENDTKTCKPENETNNMIIVPCGLIAWSLFNDTYSFTLKRSNLTDVKLTVNTKEISWKSDRDHKFGKGVKPKNFQKSDFIGGKSLDHKKPLREQEDLIVWMRTAALPNFRKLYGKIENDLTKGDKIEVILQNNYNTYSFGGKKKIVLSTTTWIGGKNNFIGIAYIVVGGLCLSLALCFSILHLVNSRQLGDPTYLSWNRNLGGH